jgi:hypothetical protein
MPKKDIRIAFNFCSRGKRLQDYTVTLTKEDGKSTAKVEAFRLRLTQWLRMQGDDFKGNAEEPLAARTTAGDPRLLLRCTEEAMARIERQFAGDILRVEPPALHQRGTIFPPKVDPWDTSKW